MARPPKFNTPSRKIGILITKYALDVIDERAPKDLSGKPDRSAYINKLVMQQLQDSDQFMIESTPLIDKLARHYYDWVDYWTNHGLSGVKWHRGPPIGWDRFDQTEDKFYRSKNITVQRGFIVRNYRRIRKWAEELNESAE